MFYSFALQPPPPRWNFLTGADGAGAGGVGAGRAGAGGSGSAGKVSAGIPDHSSLALLKSVYFRHRPSTAPLRNQCVYYHRPVTALTKKQ